jgi:hypothetical protein
LFVTTRVVREFGTAKFVVWAEVTVGEFVAAGSDVGECAVGTLKIEVFFVINLKEEREREREGE